MPGPKATPEYTREAAATSAAAMEHLSAAGKRCLDEAERQSRHLDDNHVGTEHIVLGVLAGDPDVTSILARNGITRTYSGRSSSRSLARAPSGASR